MFKRIDKISHDKQTHHWLANQFLLFSIGIYTTLVGITVISFLGVRLGLGAQLSTFAGFLITILARTFYEQLVIFNIPTTALEPGKNILFASSYATIMSFVFYGIIAPLGYWSIPIVLVLTQAVIKPLKAYLWPAKPRSELYALYDTKQGSFMVSLYGFFGLLAFIAVTGVKTLHLDFIYAFSSAVFIAIIASVLFEWHYLYQQRVSLAFCARWILTALILSIISTTAITGVVTILSISGQAATIPACIAVKILEQYLLNRSLLLLLVRSK